MKLKYFLHWRHAFTPSDFQMHQQSLDHSYCKRENSLTKLNNSKKCDDFSGEISQLTDKRDSAIIYTSMIIVYPLV
jgi:hypothetical protein